MAQSSPTISALVTPSAALSSQIHFAASQRIIFDSTADWVIAPGVPFPVTQLCL
jgi:hypothetical protein